MIFTFAVVKLFLLRQKLMYIYGIIQEISRISNDS